MSILSGMNFYVLFHHINKWLLFHIKNVDLAKYLIFRCILMNVWFFLLVGSMTNMALRKFVCGATPSINLKHSSFPAKVHEQAQFEEPETNQTLEPDVEIDPREVYFLIMHFLSSGPCRRTCGLLWDELFENQLLPRRYHAWYSRNGMHSGHENDDGLSFPLSYQHLVERYASLIVNQLALLKFFRYGS